MGDYSFVSLAAVKAMLGDAQTTNDAILRRALEAAAVAAEQVAHQRFQPHLAVRYFTPHDIDELRLYPGLISITTLKADMDGDQIWETTWATTD